MKNCTKCLEPKELTEFSMILRRGKRVSDSRCKACVSAYKKGHYTGNKQKYLDKSKEQREKDPESYKAYQDAYREEHRDELRTKSREFMRTERGRELNKLRSREYREREELKTKARSAVNHAVRDGKLVKPEHCEECGRREPVEGHHDDYNKPLEVRWLCKQCHEDTHHLNEGRVS